MNYRIYNGQSIVTDFEAETREEALEKALNWSGLSLLQIDEEDKE